MVNVKVYLVLSLLEGTVNIVFGLPYTRDTMFIISEPLLKVSAKLAQESSVRSLFVDLCAER